MTALVLAATPWPTNADLIAACAQLGYLKPTDLILDPTFGRGIWWKRWGPAEDRLIVNDINRGGFDFREMPYRDGLFDAVAFDPPYVCIGGRRTTGMADFHGRYGLTGAPRTPAELQELINAGLAECHRVVKNRGIVLVKCQDYISSGRLWPGTHHTLCHALEVGFELVDRLERIQPNPRPQPGNRFKNGAPTVQQHARRNLSTLFVLRCRKSLAVERPRVRPVDGHSAQLTPLTSGGDRPSAGQLRGSQDGLLGAIAQEGTR